jgi:hypothetical protein
VRKITIGLLLVALSSLPVANAGKPPGAGGGGTGGGGTGTEGIVGQNLGVLVGDKYSDAWDVNAAGHVVGRSYNSGSRKAPQVIKAFYWNGTTMSRLLPATNGFDAEAYAISNMSGSSETAAGYEYKDACGGSSEPCTREQYPVIWRGDLSSDAAGVRLACGGGGGAHGINDSGELAVGRCGDVYATSGPVIGVIWNSTTPGVATPIVANSPRFPAADLEPSFPDGHSLVGHTIGLEGTAWDVNNDGIVVGTVTWVDETAAEACYLNRPNPCAVDVSYSKAYIYDSVAKKGIILEPAGDDVQSSAYAVSNKKGGSNEVYVAGTTIPCSKRSQCGSRGIRWTANPGSGAVVAKPLAEQAWAEGVNENGFVAGTHNSEPSRRGNIIQTATLYSEPVGYIPLKPPGGSDSASRGMAGQCAGAADTIHVVGVVNVSGTWTAARWGIPCSTADPSP